MDSPSLPTAEAGPASTSVGAKLLNLFVSPSMVFDEVAVQSPRVANWLVPTVLVCLSSLVFLNATTDAERTAAAIGKLLDAGNITADQAAAVSTHWQSFSQTAVCLGAFTGTVWSAFVIWFIGRMFLNSRFRFRKALEVAGLSGTVLMLGTVVTGLLVLATGDTSARPALSLLCLKLDPGNPLRTASEVLNFFHLWTTGALAIGLSRLAGVSVKESAFWVFGYWVVVRIALIVLA
jgi:hypothetical protein